MFTDDEEYVIAEDEADARVVMRELTGDSLIWGNDVDIFQCPDGHPLLINDEAEFGTLTKTCGEWASEKGRGYLCGPG